MLKWCEYLRENQNITIIRQDEKTMDKLMARSQRRTKDTQLRHSVQMSYMNTDENLKEIA